MARKGKSKVKAPEPLPHDALDVLAWLPGSLREPDGVGRISLTSHLLGIALGLGVGLLLLALYSGTGWMAIAGGYLVAVATFHQSEFLAITLVQAKGGGTDEPFLVSHHVDYAVALLGSWGEFFLKFAVFPDWRPSLLVSIAGAALVAVGYCTRLAAIATLRSDFESPPGEMSGGLHTDGIYRWLRHPADAGFFWWGVGTQLLLHNPLCLVAFVAVAWGPLREGAAQQEAVLLAHPDHGPRYADYRRRVRSGFPFTA